MIFLLFLLLSVSIGNIFVTMFFPYPTALMSLGIQFLLFITGLIVFLRSVKKRRKVIRSFTVTALHGSALIFMIYIFFNVTIPNREKGESDAVTSALKGAYRYFSKTDSKQEKSTQNSVQNKGIENNNPDAENKQTQKPGPLVDDPF